MHAFELSPEQTVNTPITPIAVLCCGLAYDDDVPLVIESAAHKKSGRKKAKKGKKSSVSSKVKRNKKR